MAELFQLQNLLFISCKEDLKSSRPKDEGLINGCAGIAQLGHIMINVLAKKYWKFDWTDLIRSECTE